MPPASKPPAVVGAFVEAGIRAILDSGVDRVSVSEVTRLANASRPTFYSYFGDIQGLFAEIWVERGQEFLDRLNDPSFELESATPEIQGRIRALLELFCVARRIPELAEVIGPLTAVWWRDASGDTEFQRLKTAWLLGSRIGSWLTLPVSPEAVSARIVESVIPLLGTEPSGVPADPRFAALPALSSPNLAETSQGTFLESALRVIALSGVAAASMTRIARNARVTTGAVYPRFGSTRELILASFGYAISGVTEQNFSFVEGGSFAPDQFGAIVLAGLRPGRETWRNFRVEMHLEARVNRELAEALRSSLNSTNERVVAGLKVLPAGRQELEAVAYLVHCIGIGMAILLNNGIPVADLDHRLMTRELVAAMARRGS